MSNAVNKVEADVTSSSSTARHDETSYSGNWSARKRIIISALVTLHLFAVLAAPLSNPPPSSQLFNRITYAISPYLQAFFLNHGYRFFAPEPGPSHLIRFEIFADETEQPGEIPEYSGIFPDRKRHWPRQLYHRWFMLSETVFAEHSMIPTEAQFNERITQAEEVLKELRDSGEHAKAAYLEEQLKLELQSIEYNRAQMQRLLEAIGQHLLRVHGGRRIRLHLRERQLAPMLDVAFGTRLDDPMYYRDFETELGSTVRAD